MVNKLQFLRNKNCLTQQEVVKAISKTTSYYGMLETGKRKPSIEVAYALAKFYSSTVEEIFLLSETTLSWMKRIFILIQKGCEINGARIQKYLPNSERVNRFNSRKIIWTNGYIC